LLHFSIAMRVVAGLPGQIGIALCGMRDVVDQERVSLADIRLVPIYRLRRCVSCRYSLTSMGLVQQARMAVAAMIKT
jgi:hypothetical protein